MRKLLSLIMIGITVLFAVVSLTACSEPIETVSVYSEFKTLQEAYRADWITVEDFEYIRDNEQTPENYVELSADKREKILQDYKQKNPMASDDIEIINYGSYNGCNVVWIKDNYYGNPFESIPFPERYPYSIKRIKRGNVRASAPIHFMFLRVWKENESMIEIEKPEKPYGAFYTFKRAFELGFFAKEQFTSKLNEKNYLMLQSEKDVEPLDWQETKGKIEHDFKLLDIDREVDEMSEYSPRAFYCGEINENMVVNVSSTYIYSVYYDWYDYISWEFDLDDEITYRDRYPLRVVWIPFEEQ